MQQQFMHPPQMQQMLQGKAASRPTGPSIASGAVSKKQRTKSVSGTGDDTLDGGGHSAGHSAGHHGTLPRRKPKPQPRQPKESKNTSAMKMEMMLSPPDYQGQQQHQQGQVNPLAMSP